MSLWSKAHVSVHVEDGCLPDTSGYCVRGTRRRQARDESEVWRKTGDQTSSLLLPCDCLCHSIPPSLHPTQLPLRLPLTRRRRRYWTGLPLWSPLRAWRLVARCSLSMGDKISKKNELHIFSFRQVCKRTKSRSKFPHIVLSSKNFTAETFPSKKKKRRRCNEWLLQWGIVAR